jgi:hypothetical protein
MQRNPASPPTTRARASEKKQAAAGRKRVPALSTSDEAALASITTSGQFTLDKVLNMYAGVRRLRDQK